MDPEMDAMQLPADVAPLLGATGYLADEKGIAGALLYIDDLVVVGHSLATFEELVEVVGGA